MKATAIIVALFLALLSKAQTYPSANDFLKAEQQPVWTFTPHFTKDKILYSSLVFSMCDSLIILTEERLLPNEGSHSQWLYYVLSAKTGRKVRELHTGADGFIVANGNVLEIEDSVITDINPYNEKSRWQFNINKFFSGDIENKNIIFYFLYDYHLHDNTLYISVEPDYGSRKPWHRRKDQTSGNLPKVNDPAFEKKHKYLFLVDINTGRIISHKRFNEPIRLVYNDTLICGRDSRQAFDAKTGNKIWDLDSKFRNPNSSSSYINLNLYSELYTGVNTITYTRTDDYRTGEILDSAFGAIIDKKTGKAANVSFIGKDTYYHLATPDSTSLYFLQDSLTAYDAVTMRKKWTLSAKMLENYGINSINNENVKLKRHAGTLILLDSNCRLMSIDRETGTIKWCKKFDYRALYAGSNFDLISNYAVISMATIHGVYASNEHTLVVNLNNPNDTATDGTIFSLVHLDDRTKSAYLFNDTTFELIKVAIP